MECRTAQLGAGLVASLVLLASCGGGSDDVTTDDFDDDPGAAILDDLGVGGDDSSDADGGGDEGGSDAAAGGSGAGAGTIVIRGVGYSYEAELCFETPTFLQISGSGLRADGVPFYGSISVNQDEDVDEDGTPDPTGTVEIEFGTDSPFDSAPDDEPSYEATLLVVGDQIDVRDFEYELGGSDDITGSGSITDNHAVETDYGEYVDLVFSGSCV